MSPARSSTSSVRTASRWSSGRSFSRFCQPCELTMFKKILIANRGEIAMRVLRACRILGIRTVAIHSTADEAALHVRFADEAVCVGPAESAKSYLNVPAIIAAAEVTNADAIHPGYGFLSENSAFAELCKKCRLTFIGPSPDAMQRWG